jgi:hypothetical protein
MRHNPYVLDSRPAFVTDMTGDGDLTDNDSDSEPKPPEYLTLIYKNFFTKYKESVETTWSLWENEVMDNWIEMGVDLHLGNCVRVDSTYHTSNYWSTNFDEDMTIEKGITTKDVVRELFFEKTGIELAKNINQKNIEKYQTKFKELVRKNDYIDDHLGKHLKSTIGFDRKLYKLIITTIILCSCMSSRPMKISCT